GGLHRRPRRGRLGRRLSPFRGLSPWSGLVVVVNATAAHDAERIQRMARLLRDRLGAKGRVSPGVTQLRSIRCVARARGGALDAAADPASRAPATSACISGGPTAYLPMS